MNAAALKKDLRKRAIECAILKGVEESGSHPSAFIFKNPKDNFNPKSYKAIENNGDWDKRLDKAHTDTSVDKEMQSSNSSDALLMNIFCYPEIHKWKGVRDVLHLKKPFTQDDIKFGVKAEVPLKNNSVDRTEIDLALPGIYCEAKLTEVGFTDAAEEKVENYLRLDDFFSKDKLPRNERNGKYRNYQLIRNLLACINDDKKHILFCDERRHDLVHQYMETVACLQNVDHRKRCRIVFWQELVAACGKDLREWVKLKYGM